MPSEPIAGDDDAKLSGVNGLTTILKDGLEGSVGDMMNNVMGMMSSMMGNLKQGTNDMLKSSVDSQLIPVLQKLIPKALKKLKEKEEEKEKKEKKEKDKKYEKEKEDEKQKKLSDPLILLKFLLNAFNTIIFINAIKKNIIPDLLFSSK